MNVKRSYRKKKDFENYEKTSKNYDDCRKVMGFNIISNTITKLKKKFTQYLR